MRIGFASQYNTTCVIIESEDSAEDVISYAVANEATYYDGEECVVVDFQRGVGPEVYTKKAVRRSIAFRKLQEVEKQQNNP